MRAALCPLAFHCSYTHSAASLLPITHREYTTCLSAGWPFNREALTKPPLSLALGCHKRSRSGVAWKTGAPSTLLFFFFKCFFFFSLAVPLLCSPFLESPASNSPPPPFLPPPSFCPLFCRSSGPIVWTASSTPSSSSGSPLKPSSTVSSSQTPPQLSGGWRGRIVKFTYFVLISSLFIRPAMNCKHVCAESNAAH